MGSDGHLLHIHPSLWDDRLRRVRAAGLNAVQLYIPWSFHEQKVGRFNFDGDRNISRFIRMAQQNELFVLIRMGPYVCAELDFGGFPWWLTKDQADITLRTSDKRFLGHVRRWFSALLPILRPLLYKNGGPILMVQIENEYGSVSPCDFNYMRWLRDFVRQSLGDDVVLYTTDGPSEKMLRCGSIDDTFATVDFGTQPTEASVKAIFELQRNWSRGGPSVNSEFYTTWFSMWGDKSMVRQQLEPVLKTMDFMWAQNASFSLYMIHGGTSFAFWNGRESNGPVITSYDYAAPIGEAGQITSLYKAIRNWIGARKNWPNPPLPLPENRTGVSIQNVFGVKLADFIALTNSSSNASENRLWICMVQRISRGQFELENIGRLTFPLTKVDPRGLFSPPFIDGKVISDRWVQCGVNLDNLQAKIEAMMNERANSKIQTSHPHIDEKPPKFRSISHEPSIFAAKFSTSNIDWTEMDTFLDTRGWGHGVAIANGFNLGRYWPLQGPQLSLFVPGAVMKRENLVILLELAGCQKHDTFIDFVSEPVYTWSQNDNDSGNDASNEPKGSSAQSRGIRQQETISNSRRVHRNNRSRRRRDNFDGGHRLNFFAHF
uniref:Beta-galactosidase n=1 Tax=Globodera pallida TaxID=36090 RepID=A0A183BQ51_GLOPA